MSKMICLQDPFILLMNPCKKNLVYAVRKFRNIIDSFNPMVKKLAELRSEMPQITEDMKITQTLHHLQKFIRGSLYRAS